MTSFKIAPLEKDRIRPYFEVVICNSVDEMREFADIKDDEVGVFIINSTDGKNHLKLATILLLRTELNQINLTLQASRAGMLMGEILATAIGSNSKKTEDFYLTVSAETTAIMLARMNHFVEKHFVGVEFAE